MKTARMMSVVLTMSLGFGTAFASGDHAHDHGSHDHGRPSQVQMSHDEMFLVEKKVNDYDVSFHVMAAQQGMEHGGSHNFMIKIEAGDKILNDVKINSKVIYPDGNSDTKPLMKMGDWYMNGYDMGGAGKYQLMVLFKTADGQKHKAGVYYSVK